VDICNSGRIIYVIISKTNLTCNKAENWNSGQYNSYNNIHNLIYPATKQKTATQVRVIQKSNIHNLT
jgi:hypothetical protein